MQFARLMPACLLLALACIARGADKPTPCPIVPPPKEYRDLNRTLTLETPGVAAIVVGAKATEPERYAAEQLQTQIERRFKRKLPISLETDIPVGARQVLLLGQVDTNGLLAELCKKHKIELSADSPGHDGFVIRFLDDGPRQVVLIGGGNPRGVIYGQNTVFDLMRAEGEKVVLPVVEIRDWPSIAWRGRPHSVIKQHLVPGALDAYLHARINFTDVRDDQDVKPTIVFPARKASMGLPPGKPLDRPLISRMIAESHRRGLFVYGTVSCAVKPEQIGLVIKTFQELIDLGVDGLWISFDDTGAGDSAQQVITRVLELGAKHDMTGRKIAITPPWKEYQTIDMPFNHTAATEWGMAEAQWLFTRTPCVGDAATARRIGMKSLPGWWHNLVNMRGGFLHNGGVLCPLRKNWKPGYVNIQPLEMGWHQPKYDQLRDAAKNTSCVLLWGVCGGWPEEYQVGDIGRWSWEPARYDWQCTRRAIYGQVYGPDMVETAATLDDKLSALKDLFELPPWHFWPAGSKSYQGWPCRLKDVADRPKALALLDELDKLAAVLNREAPSQTAIDATRLENVYLEPLRATLDYARRMALLDYPEHLAADIEQTILGLLDTGKVDEAEQFLKQTRAKVEPQLVRIERELGDLKEVDNYVATWRRRLGSIDHWKQLAKQRRQRMTGYFRKLIKSPVADLFPYKQSVRADELDLLLAGLSNPPDGKPLAELKAADWLGTPPYWRGEFCLGPFDFKGNALVAIGYPRTRPSKVGDRAEVSAKLPVPKSPSSTGSKARLMLDFFVNDTRLENRYPGHRYMQLWINDRLAWEEDIAPARPGNGWVSLDVTESARGKPELQLRFRVIDKRRVGDHLTVTYLGPVRLRAVGK